MVNIVLICVYVCVYASVCLSIHVCLYASTCMSASFFRVNCLVSLKKFNFRRKIDKKGNREDMRKIYVTRQFFEASGPQDHFYEKPVFR